MAAPQAIGSRPREEKWGLRAIKIPTLDQQSRWQATDIIVGENISFMNGGNLEYGLVERMRTSDNRNDGQYVLECIAFRRTGNPMRLQKTDDRIDVASKLVHQKVLILHDDELPHEKGVLRYSQSVVVHPDGTYDPPKSAKKPKRTSVPVSSMVSWV